MFLETNHNEKTTPQVIGYGKNSTKREIFISEFVYQKVRRI
jgi:hypothetical protein